MSRNTKRNLSLADEMAAAGFEPFWVGRVRSLVLGYASLRGTCSLLHKDNAKLRAQLGLQPLPFSDKDPAE